MLTHVYRYGIPIKQMVKEVDYVGKTSVPSIVSSSVVHVLTSGNSRRYSFCGRSPPRAHGNRVDHDISVK